MKSFNGVNFKLNLPTCKTEGNSVYFNTSFVFHGEKAPVVFEKAVLVNRFGETISGHLGILMKPERLMNNIKFSLTGKKSIYMTKAQLEMHFLRNSGDKVIVSYLFDINKKSSLEDVKCVSVTNEEYEYYNSIVSSKPQKEEKTIIQSDGEAGSTDLIKIIKPYLDALQSEKKYLMAEGGRKYKVTNGRYIGRDNNRYSYVFDLETELHLSDDAPIVLSVGMDKTSGTVMMSEDFQIVVVVNSFMGHSIGTAYINVEPWRLLDALEERIHYELELNSNMVRQLCEGCNLATHKPIEEIAKGQEAAVKQSMSKPVTIVWGPPGTGKTYTMAEVAIRFLLKKKSVLVVSHSNVSVDGITEQIGSFLQVDNIAPDPKLELLLQGNKERILKNGSVLRYGYIRDDQLRKDKYLCSFSFAANKDPRIIQKLDSLQKEYEKVKATSGIASGKMTEIHNEIKSIRAKVREIENTCVQKAQIVATTISKATIDPIFKERVFDVVIFDEVSMAYVPQIISAATFAREHLICVGDFMQLSPIVQSSSASKLSEDIFDFLGINDHGTPYYHPWLIMLDEQRRMHPSISKFPSVRIYKKMLRDHPSVLTSKEKIVKSEPFSDNPINFIDLMSTYCASSKNVDNSRYNILSGLLAFSIALRSRIELDSVSVITPYAAQTRLIRALILDYRKKEEVPIRCATVHQFQGSESDMVIFDAVESYPGKKPGWLMSKDFKSIKRLINVAVTRARGKLVVVANGRFWEDNYKVNQHHMFYQLLKYLEIKGNVVRYKDDHALIKMVDELPKDMGPRFFTDNGYLELLLKDIEKAKGRIIVSAPSGRIEELSGNSIFDKLIKARKKGVDVVVKCNNVEGLPLEWKKIAVSVTNATFPLVMIDDKITWYGVPVADWKFVIGNTAYGSPCKIACRIRGEHTAEMIRSLTGIDSPVGSGSGDGVIGGGGLVEYASKLIKCPGCGKYMVMSKGKSGKTILYCKLCNKTELLSPDDINSYIYKYGVKCPEHHADIEAKVGRYGLYIKCGFGHYLKPEQI